MDYYIYLAEEQNARFAEFQKANSQYNRMENRILFFSQPFEINVSHSICTGIARMKKAQDNQK